MLKNIDCGYSNLCIKQKYEKYQNFSSENFHVLVVKFSVYLNRHVFIMQTETVSFANKVDPDDDEPFHLAPHYLPFWFYIFTYSCMDITIFLRTSLLRKRRGESFDKKNKRPPLQSLA